MSKINVLDKQIAELIAAGEVVERPASVIKELVENSIDAGATSITVEIRQGGISYIRITDNGSGILKEDVPTAFLRHATSKINIASDLDSIGTLGFRGEALASVSAVSHIELVTKALSEDIGTKIVLHGGEIEYMEDTGTPQGTTIIVRDIFYNVPARMKFLKKDVGEGNAVATIIDKIALSHPEISFRFIRDRKETLYTQGDGKLSSAIYGVYGKDFLNGLMPTNYSFNGIKVTGYISKPSNSRASRTMQNFFINGRYIRSKTAIAAIDEAFKGSIMVGKFPSCVLNLEMNSSLYDVNVHPAKLEVRFASEKAVFDAVYHAVKSSLLSEDKIKEMELKPKIVNPYTPVLEKAEQIKLPEIKPITKPITPIERPIERPIIPFKTETTILQDSEKIKIEFPVIPTKFEKIIEQEVTPIVVEEKKAEVIIKEISAHKLIGEVFSTYIIIEYEDSLMFIDKHAAHERLIYEKLKNDSKSFSQSLLTPISVCLDKLSFEAVESHLEDFEKAGFEIEIFGTTTVLVRSAPLNLTGQDISSAVVELALGLTKFKSDMTTEYIDWLYHNVACRAAIKGGQVSPKEELIELAKRLEQNPELRFCPHGRPVYIMLKKSEIEKQFGR